MESEALCNRAAKDSYDVLIGRCFLIGKIVRTNEAEVICWLRNVGLGSVRSLVPLRVAEVGMKPKKRRRIVLPGLELKFKRLLCSKDSTFVPRVKEFSSLDVIGEE